MFQVQLQSQGWPALFLCHACQKGTIRFLSLWSFLFGPPVVLLTSEGRRHL
uniref:Uncharacterized protein n=1 Tax=Anguilla anguilla TaxID=7936 RepID=A0A0E9S4F8_ANGAN